MVALMERYQDEAGGIAIPEPLHDYVGFSRIDP
jgi:seryl-tRNA synthetase